MLTHIRLQDRPFFSQAAQQFRAWILVRQTNPASLPYFGRTGYVPKRIDCKAKTADCDASGRQLAGLVVDPIRHPTAFATAKRDEALKCWAKMKIGPDGKNGPYVVQPDEKSPHFGCLMFQGNYIHGDYDLYDIILVDHPRANLAAVEELHGQVHMRGPRLIPIQNFINQSIGIPVVQHGGEMQYANHSKQSIEVFGPAGEQFLLRNKAVVQDWYDRVWQRRSTKDKPW